MAEKLIKNVDNDMWRKFTGHCKMKNVLVGEELTKILRGYLKNV